MKFSFGKKQTFTFKDVIIDEKIGYPIIIGGVEVGGILVDVMVKPNKWKVVRCKGIEILPKHRRKGFGKMIIKYFTKRFDGMIGAITEDDNKKFWKKMGAEFLPIPLDLFEEKHFKTMHTNEPLFFVISQHVELRKLMLNTQLDVMKKFTEFKNNIKLICKNEEKLQLP